LNEVRFQAFRPPCLCLRQATVEKAAADDPDDGVEVLAVARAVSPRIRLPVLAEVPLMFCDSFQLSPPIHNCQESYYDKKPMECGRGVVQVAYQRGNQ
jgi:hypothetical protein